MPDRYQPGGGQHRRQPEDHRVLDGRHRRAEQGPAGEQQRCPQRVRSASRRRKPLHVFALQAGLLSLVLVYLPGMDRVYPALFNAHAEVVYNVALELLSEDQFEEWVRAEEMIGPKA